MLALGGLCAIGGWVRAAGTRSSVASALAGVLIAPLVALAGAAFAMGVLGGFLHGWQTHDLAGLPIGFGCRPAGQAELMRLEVLGLPSQTADGSRFDAKVVSIREGCAALLGQRLRVSWKAATWPSAGQRIVAQARLRPIRGSVSPGAFDIELNLARRGIRVSAYLTQTLAVSEPRGFGARTLSRVRLAVRRALEAMPFEHRGVLLALLTGDSALIPRASWVLLQATGTVHLLVISGLHVGLVAVGLLFIVRGFVGLFALLQRRVSDSNVRWQLGGRVNRRVAEGLLAALLLSGYVVFVGAGIAAVRALLMVGVVIFAWSAGRQVSVSSLLVVAGAAVVASEPGAGLAAGFWLSFGLVSWLLVKGAATAHRQSDGVSEETRSLVRRGWLMIRTLLALHLGCSLVLVPLLAWLGLPIALVSPVANLLAVPVVTLLLVPLVLCGGLLLLFSAQASSWVFGLADAVADAVLLGLDLLGATLPLVSPPELTGVGYVTFGGLLVAALLPASGALRIAAGSVLIYVCYAESPSSWSALTRAHTVQIGRGEFVVQLLDVGQGLAAVVQTTSQTLLYDTGARFPSGFNFAEAVIGPALQASAVTTLDALIISHHDLDHAGGLDYVIKRYDPQRLIGGIRDAGCEHAGRLAGWQVDGVQFLVVQHRGGVTSNDRSCVLVIRGLTKSAVIAGDIESNAERALLAQLPQSIDLLVVPHHGSKTSSTTDFVAALRPAIALISSGFGNRFGHPHQEVVERYLRVGAQVLSTAELGTLQWRSQSAGMEVISARRQRLRRWQLGAPLVLDKSSGSAN